MGVYHYFQQFLNYIMTTRLIGEVRTDTMNWLVKPQILGKCLESLTLEVGNGTLWLEGNNT
jgi:hypothetical protein